MLSQDEIDAAAGEQSRLIEIEEFVVAAEIDPVFYDRGYYLGAGKDGEDAYRLLHDALAKAQRVGIGRWVFHNREYLVAIRALDDVLALHTDALRRRAGQGRQPRCSRRPAASRAKREVEMAGTLVESLHDGFDPGDFRTTTASGCRS